jgi:hypothetical protein
MEVLQHLNELAALGAGLTLLCLQLWAFRRYRHFSFVLLAVSTVAGLFHGGLFGASYFFPIIAANYQLSFTLASCFFVAQIVFGIWGTVALFRSYGALVSSQTRGHA